MNRKANFWQSVLLVMVLTYVMQAVHEGGHWLVYQLAGRGPVWGFTSLIQLWDESPLHPEEWVQMTAPDGSQGWLRLASLPANKDETTVMLAAGPLAGLLATVCGLASGRFSKNPVTRRTGLTLALVGSLSAGLYYLCAPFRGTTGDEYFIAANLGIPQLFIDLPLGVAFGVCFWLGMHALTGWRERATWIGSILVGSPITGVTLMQANTLVTNQINQSNPLFQPVLGYSLPVCVANGAVLIALALWWYQAARVSAQPTGQAGA